MRIRILVDSRLEGYGRLPVADVILCVGPGRPPTVVRVETGCNPGYIFATLSQPLPARAPLAAQAGNISPAASGRVRHLMTTVLVVRIRHRRGLAKTASCRRAARIGVLGCHEIRHIRARGSILFCEFLNRAPRSCCFWCLAYRLKYLVVKYISFLYSIGFRGSCTIQGRDTS